MESQELLQGQARAECFLRAHWRERAKATGMLLMFGLAALHLYLIAFFPDAYEPDPLFTIDQTHLALLNAVRPTWLTAAGRPIAVAASWLAWLRSKPALAMARATEMRQMEGRFRRANDQLGALKGDKPNIEVRIDGIFALERITHDAPKKYHWRIIKVLTAYVRENHRFERDPAEWQTKAGTISEKIEPVDSPDRLEVPPVRLDVQAALTVVGRRETVQDKGPVLFSRTDLRGYDLSGANLEGASLEGARLEGAILNHARLNGADFSKASLQRASLVAAQLQEAKLRNANLLGADLQAAHLEGANLIEACLYGVNLTNAHMQGAHLILAFMVSANFRTANLEGADLCHSNLDGAELGHANLHSVDLSEASLVNANLSVANLSEANLSQAILARANLDGANLEGANLNHTILEGTSLSQADLEGALRIMNDIPGWKADADGKLHRSGDVSGDADPKYLWPA